MVCAVGVDPGIRGGVSLIVGTSSDVVIAQALPMPLTRVMVRKGASKDRVSDDGLCKLLKDWDGSFHIDSIFIEKQIVISGQGLTSNGVTMEGFGLIRGLCTGLGLPYQVVAAKTWQSFYEKDDSENELDIKKLSIIWAKKLFPEASLLRTKRSKTDSDGLSDALLIGYYGLSLLEESMNKG